MKLTHRPEAITYSVDTVENIEKDIRAKESLQEFIKNLGHSNVQIDPECFEPNTKIKVITVGGFNLGVGNADEQKIILKPDGTWH